jgi:hypothetical protein
VTNGEHDGNGEPPVRPEDDGEPGPELDFDSAFAAIVAGWSDDAGPATGSWPAQEDVDPAAPAAGAAHPPVPPAGTEGDTGEAREARDRRRDDAQDDDGPADGDLVLPAVVVGGGGMTGRAPGPRDTDPNAPEPPEEGFVPPEPPPLPRGDLMTRALWAAVIGGPLFLLIAAVAWRDAPRILILAAVAAFVGGFVMLVVRMPHDRGEDDDDGAVV